MDVIKAIETLKENKERKTASRYVHIKYMAIDALEKQFPMKPKLHNDNCYHCSVCGCDVIGRNKSYCHNCGQKLEWEEE